MEEVVRGRMGMYTFFSLVLLDIPPKELLKEIYDGSAKFPELDGVDIIVNYPKKFKTFEEFEKAIREEYTALFVDPFGDFVSPYKSNYEGENPYGKVTLKTLEMFKKFGYDYKYVEPADHIGVFMAFMAKSCEEFLKGNRDELKKQRDVLHEIERWVFDFCERVEKHREAKFYKGISKMLRDFIKLDKKLINELMLYASR